MDLASVTLNRRKIIALPIMLEALVAAHRDLITAGIGYQGMLGFVVSSESTGSWRSLALQKQLVAKGASKTLYSNHRRGTAVDCVADWDYIEKIRPIMNQHELVNDLAYIAGDKTDDDPFTGSIPWDGGHWNWQSNVKAQSYPIIDVLTSTPSFFMSTSYENTIIWLAQTGVANSGAFAAVYGGEKHLISKERHGTAALHPLFSGKKTRALDKVTWDSIPTGDAF